MALNKNLVEYDFTRFLSRCEEQKLSKGPYLPPTSCGMGEGAGRFVDYCKKVGSPDPEIVATTLYGQWQSAIGAVTGAASGRYTAGGVALWLPVALASLLASFASLSA